MKLKKVNKKERKFLGVCGGLSKHIDPELDPVIFRVIWVVGSIFCWPLILIYFIFAIVLKSE